MPAHRGLFIIALVAVLLAILWPVIAPVIAPLTQWTVALLVLATLPAILATILTVILATLIAALLVILLALFLLCRHLPRRFRQKPRVMFGMLREILRRDPVIRQLRIPRQKLIFLDQLGRGATHFAFRARAVKDPVDDVAEGARAVRFRTRAGLGRAHIVL